MLLIFGKNGQLGQAFQKNFDNNEIVCLGKSQCDITNRNDVAKAIQTYKPSVIINCAAYTDVKKAENQETDLAFAINAEAINTIAQESAKSNISFIHISTDYVFDGQSTTPYLETDKPNPINEYGRSKLLGEQYFHDHAARGALIRVSHLSSEFGNNIVKTFVKLLSTLDEITVVEDQRICITYADDVCDFIKTLINHDLFDKQIWHVGSSNELSFVDLAVEIKNKIHSKTHINEISLHEFSSDVQKPLYSVLDVSKAHVIHPQKPWQDGLKLILKDLGYE